jgi:predicted patatin/cPLA2 family phospholipase
VILAEITRLLTARAARGSVHPHHDDGASIALCVEGGAMRGVVSAGMVSALEEMGLVNAFDAIYGSSAGAVNAAYFLAGQARLGTTIYYEDINTRDFIDMRRMIGGRPVVNLGFLLDDVAVRRKVLDTARVIESPTPLAVIATNADTAAPVVFRAFTSAADLLTALRASSTMPVAAGSACEYRGGRYYDASVSEPIPLPSAEADGHTHILVLLTRPRGETRQLSAFDRYYVIPRLRRAPRIAQSYRDRIGPYSALVERIVSFPSSKAGTPRPGPNIAGLYPTGGTIGILERRREVLVAGAERGHRAVMDAFGRAFT